MVCGQYLNHCSLLGVCVCVRDTLARHQQPARNNVPIIANKQKGLFQRKVCLIMDKIALFCCCLVGWLDGNYL